MNTEKLQQEIKIAEEALNRMKEQLNEEEKKNDKNWYPIKNGYGGNFNAFDVDEILGVIDNDNLSIHNRPILWYDTPQGHKYWFDIRLGVIPFTEEDKITLLRWCVNYYKANS